MLPAVLLVVPEVHFLITAETKDGYFVFEDAVWLTGDGDLDNFYIISFVAIVCGDVWFHVSHNSVHSLSECSRWLNCYYC